MKKIIKKYFESLAYFYSHLRYRVFVVLGLSILVGVLDGFGLTMFLPLLQMVSDESSVNPENLGKLSFLIKGIESLGIKINLLAVLLIMAMFFFLKGIVQYATGVYKVNVQQRFISRLRLKNIEKLNNLSYKYFVSSDIGRIQNTLTGEVDRVARAYKNYFTSYQHIVMVIVYMTFAFFIDAQFAVLVSIGGVLTNFLFKGLYKKTKGSSKSLTSESHNFQSLVIQNVSNFKYLKATGSIKKYAAKLNSSVRGIESSNKRIGKLDAILVAGREPILITVVIAVIYIQTAVFGSELGPILISLVFFYRALNYLMQMQINWNKFLSVSGSLNNVSSFEKELKENRDTVNKGKELKTFEELQLKNVSFSYGDKKVLENVNLMVRKNETVAFVGESGSGKTTLINLISGLLFPKEGEIILNQNNAKIFSISSFQSKVGYITQDAVIFNDTIYNNVTFWAKKSPENMKKFWDALAKAEIEFFVKNQKEAENTILGNNGVNLSGGQKQRISIARELFKDIEILILDEATSALDSETEKAIQKNIENLKGQYTILSIAHRLSTIKYVDRIYVMKAGKISTTGNFQELLSTSDYFRSLVQLQNI